MPLVCPSYWQYEGNTRGLGGVYEGYMRGIVWVAGLIGCRGAWKGERGKTVDSTWRQRLNLKRAVPPQRNTDGHGLAAYGRATPPHPGKGNAEKLKPNPCPPPLPISAFQYFSFCPGGFIVATAVFRFHQRNPLFPGTQCGMGQKNVQCR